jgi:NAD(P)-dependent dehydrogenase (short-subunit alcohol dehydrogenase family)
MGRSVRAQSSLNEDKDAQEVARIVEEAGRRCVLASGDLADPAHCRSVIDRAVEEFGGVDALASNSAYQMTRQSLDEISDEECDYTFRLNVGAEFYLAKTAVPHMDSGSSIIGSSSVNSEMPNPTLAPYAATKAAIANFSAISRSFGVQRNPRQQRGTRTDLDTADPVEHAVGDGDVARREHATGACRAASRTGACLRASRVRRRQLHLGLA